MNPKSMPSSTRACSSWTLVLAVEPTARLAHGAPSGDECCRAQRKRDRAGRSVAGGEQESRENRDQHEREVPFAPEQRDVVRNRRHAGTSLSFAARAAAASSATLDTI